VQGSFNDQRSLVDAVKLVDVVICAVSGVHIRSHQILLQLKLVDAIKEAGNVKVDNLYESPVLSLMIVRSVLSFVISNFVPNFLLSLWLDHFSIIINVV
jgi:hypothetical protein